MRQKILIFGVGAAGRVIKRVFEKNQNFEIVGFLENNEKLNGKTYDNIPIYLASDVVSLNFDSIAIGGVWADEMMAQLINLGIDKSKFMLIDEKEITFSTPKRELTTDDIAKRLDKFLTDNGMKYYISGSSLLCMLRKKNLSDVSDIDVILFDYKDLEFLEKHLADEFSEFDIEVLRFSKDDIVRKAGDIFKIVLSSKDSEKAVFDINIYDRYKNCFILEYNGRYFYMPCAFLQEFIRYEYKNFTLSIPKRYDEYLSMYYGKNYIEIPKQFCANDYKNLVTKDELDEICKDIKF